MEKSIMKFNEQKNKIHLNNLKNPAPSPALSKMQHN